MLAATVVVLTVGSTAGFGRLLSVTQGADALLYDSGARHSDVCYPE